MRPNGVEWPRKWNEFKNGGDEKGLAPLRAQLEMEASESGG